MTELAALPPIETPRTVVDKLYLFVSDQENPSTGCDGYCQQGAGIAQLQGWRYSSTPRANLRRATVEDLERLGFVRKVEP